MIAVDTNILVYAHRAESPFHERALETLEQLGNGDDPWAIPWPCFHEFISIATHPRIYSPPSPTEVALTFLENWRQSPGLHLIAEGAGYFEKIHRFALRGKIAGPKIHDARIAAICLNHGVKTLFTADRDFSLFPDLKCANPLVR
jgi:toxin-antitoxin system PIN domain toxin